MRPPLTIADTPLASKLSFGVELEFRVTYLSSETQTPAHEHRKLHFLPISQLPEYHGTAHEIEVDTITRDIASTLASAGFPYDTSNTGSGNIHKWGVGIDDTIEDSFNIFKGVFLENERRVFYHGIEVVSPAFWCAEDALEAVGKVCGLLKKNYVLDAEHESCGVHVHVGQGTERFALVEAKRLLAFAWKFELQLSSLHPPNRQDARTKQAFVGIQHGQYFKSLRCTGNIPPENGVQTILAAKDWEELEYLTSGQRHLAYNLNNLFSLEELLRTGERDLERYKHTVEFRQHCGTLDGEAVIHWARVVIRIVEFAINENTRALMELLSSPVELTVIALLSRIDLDGEADYYQQRGLYQHQVLPRIKPMTLPTACT